MKISGAAGGIQRSTTTNSDGDYLAAGLPGGTYNLTITAKGFKTFKGKGVVLRVARRPASMPPSVGESPPRSSSKASS